MAAVLEDAGFEVCGVTSSAGHAVDPPAREGAGGESSGGGQDITSPPSALSRWVSFPGQARRTTTPQISRQAHLENCEQCRAKNQHPSSVATADDNEKGITQITELAEKGFTTGAEDATVSHPSSSTGLNQVKPSGSRSAIMSTKSFITVETEDAP